MSERKELGEELGEELDDATIVVAVDDATIVVPQRSTPDDATVVVVKPASAAEPTGPVEADVFDDATVAVSVSGSHSASFGSRSVSATTLDPVSASTGAPVGAPVEEPDEIPPALSRLFFKKPLDPKRRAPEAPFPKPQSSLPRAGVGAGIPVVYGARPEELPAQPAETELSRMIGPPPLGYELPVAERQALPSTALLNRRFRMVALGGGLGVLMVSVAGLWWVATLLLRP